MNRVFVLAPNEDWIVDRFVKEWSEDNADITVTDPRHADVLWLLADWSWDKVPPSFLAQKKVLTTVHHIVTEKFGDVQKRDFARRDRLTTAYHVYNQHTLDFIKPLTDRPIHLIPYWANQKIWRPTVLNFTESRTKYNIPVDAYVVGSFQRDTEGHDLKSPKLEKGPDLLCDYLEKLRDKHNNLYVVLAGWRRQYVIKRLETAGIVHTYFERPPQEVINDLYQTLDLYPVTARQEGGPQSLIECGLLGVPVVSRDIGIASQVLPTSAINDDVSLATPAVPDVKSMFLPVAYQPYRDLIESL